VKREKVTTEDGAAEEMEVEQPEFNGQIEADTIVSDLRDIILTMLKERPKPWDQMLEDEQRDIAAGVTNSAHDIVAAIVQLVASRDQHVIPARLEKFTGKGVEYQATLKAVGGPEIATDLAKLAGKAVLLVDADASAVYGVERPAEIDADAPELFNEAEPGEVQEPNGVDLENPE
jgi:hypothetical protein